MNKNDILQIVSKASGIPLSQLVTKERAGRQIKANALFEGSSSPASPRKQVGVFFATDAPDLAMEGASRRLSMDLPFPEAVVVLDVDNRKSRVFAYADGTLGVRIAETLGATYEAVPRPAFAREAKPAGSLEATRLMEQLRACPNVILQGPPGTGKSSIALELVRSFAAQSDEGLTSEQCRFGAISQRYSSLATMLSDADGLAFKSPIVWEMIQLHAGYAYEDLVRRVSPIANDVSLKFGVEDRLFPKLCALAAARPPDRPVLLILDEINRCNLAATFGECVFAIDPSHRNMPVRLQYQGLGLSPNLSVPENLWIVGTMNTADRSIAMMDYAIRRRFRFIDVPADAKAIASWYASDRVQAVAAAQLFEAANAELRSAFHVSHSAFMISPIPAATWPSRMARQLCLHVFPLLNEYTREGLRNPGPFIWADETFDLESNAEILQKLERMLTDRTTVAPT